MPLVYYWRKDYMVYIKNRDKVLQIRMNTFLSLTGKMSLEDVGQSVDIDLQDMNFWQNSIDMIKDDIDLFEELLKQKS